MSDLESMPDSAARSPLSRIGFIAGPCAALLIGFVLPIESLSDAGRASLALMAWMACWWITEAIDIHATALLPLVFLPMTGASGLRDAASPYASPLVFLFLGGFILAQAMQRWGLDRRFALRTLQRVGTKPTHIVAGIMFATALTSAFVSNTATAAMMLPIALGVVRWAEASAASGGGIAPQQLADFRTAMMLAVAYAASIGGLTTLVGSPPNGYLAQFVTDSLHKQLTFASWLWVGLPAALILLPLAWWMLTHVLFRLPRQPLQGGAESLRAEIAALGTMGAPQKRTIAVFLAAVLLWLGQPFFPAVISRLGDAGIAILAALALFTIPNGEERGGKLLRWSEAERIPWGVLLLFGGGLSLAAAVERNGVSQLMATAVQGLNGWPPWLLVVLVTTSVTFLTEMASNVAVTATLVPLLAAMAPGLGVAPELLILPATLAASCAFMMPAGTPPNAIVFGSGYVTIPQMVRAGWWINWIAVVVISLVVSAIAVRCEVIG